MKVPVLVVAVEPAKDLQAALAPDFAPTITGDIARARALAATGGFLATLIVEPSLGWIPGAIMIDPAADPIMIVTAVNNAVARTFAEQRSAPCTAVEGVRYDEYIELVRYAMTRRYLIALLTRHGGSVTLAARGADMKRESLHRLLRRHDLVADDFRER